VIEQREESGDEDDGRQNLEGEDGAGRLDCCGNIRLPKSPELGRPNSPKSILVPAKVQASMELTTPPAHFHGVLSVVETENQKGKGLVEVRDPRQQCARRIRLRSVENK